jgi:hypothetical protein
MKKIISQWITVFLMIFIAGCNAAESSSVGSVSGGARTWFDAPLDGSNLPLAPYPLVVHAYDPGGVTQVEISVNGVVLATLKPSITSGLALVNYTWDPKTTGNFVLRARSQIGAGSWNSEASVTVTIGDFTPTLVASFTPTIVPSSTPTHVVSFTPTKVVPFTATLVPSSTPTKVISYTPTKVPSVELTFKPNISANQIFAGNCGTNQVTIQAFVSNQDLARNVTLFIKLKDQVSGASTSWSEGDSMSPAGNGWFQRTVGATSIPNYNAYAKSWILYQFVATGSGGAITGRSQVYSDIALTTCAAPPVRIEPPVIEPVVTLTPKRFIPPPVRRVPTKTLIPSPR